MQAEGKWIIAEVLRQTKQDEYKGFEKEVQALKEYWVLIF